MSKLRNNSMCIFSGVMRGVGTKESPLLSNSISVLVNLYVLKLCTVKSVVVVLVDLSLKNEAFFSWWLWAVMYFFVFCFVGPMMMGLMYLLLPHYVV